MNNAPLLSIVVPTRNRHAYLAKLVEALLRMRSHDFEVIVHDNSDRNEHYIETFGSIRDERLRYFFVPGHMSISENCDRAVARASGCFVCMIGDDDGVIEPIVDLARWMKASGMDAAITRMPTYLWPGVSSVLDGAQTQGILRLPRYTGSVEIADESIALNYVLASGGIMIGDLPSIYGGVISKRALDELRSQAGTCFPGPSPDMANAVALSSIIDRFAKVSLPFYVSGHCASSGAAEGARHGHQGEIADRTYLGADIAERWPEQVPFFFSGSTLLASTLIHALVATGRESMLQSLRLDRLYAACAVFNSAYRERIDEVRVTYGAAISSLDFRFAVCWVWWQRLKALWGNIIQKVEGALRGERRVVGLRDIGEVITYVTDKFNRRPFDRMFQL